MIGRSRSNMRNAPQQAKYLELRIKIKLRSITRMLDVFTSKIVMGTSMKIYALIFNKPAGSKRKTWGVITMDITRETIT